jgi:quercetin dioxygenase-like cupin family protein
VQLKNISALAAACLLSSLAAAQGLESRVISGKTVESLRFGPDMTDVQILIPNDDGKGTMTAGTERLPAKVAIPVHFHPQTEEFIYVLEGEGTVTLDDKVSKVSAGDMILIAPGARHGLVNTGSGNLKMLWSYNNRKMVNFFREFSFKDAADRNARATHAFWDMLAKKYSDTIVVLLPEGEPKHD